MIVPAPAPTTYTFALDDGTPVMDVPAYISPASLESQLDQAKGLGPKSRANKLARLDFTRQFWDLVKAEGASQMQRFRNENKATVDWPTYWKGEQAAFEAAFKAGLAEAEQAADRRTALVKGLRSAQRITNGAAVEFFLVNADVSDIIDATGPKPPEGYSPNAVLDQSYVGVTFKPRASIKVHGDSTAMLVFAEPISNEQRRTLAPVLAERDIALVCDTNLVADSVVVDQSTPGDISDLVASDDEEDLMGMQYTFAWDGAKPVIINDGRKVKLSAALLAASMVAARVAKGQSGMLNAVANAVQCDEVTNTSFRNAGDITGALPFNTLEPASKSAKKEALVFSGEKSMHGNLLLSNHVARVKVLTELQIRIFLERPKIKDLRTAKAKATWLNDHFIPRICQDLFNGISIDAENVTSTKKNGRVIYDFPLKFEEHQYADLIVLSA